MAAALSRFAGVALFCALTNKVACKFSHSDCKVKVICSTDATFVAQLQPSTLDRAIQLPKALGRLLETGLHSDVTLEVEGQELPAHKAILAARSPVFKAMFEHKMSEALEGKVVIDDISLPVMRDLLKCAVFQQRCKH